MFASVELVTIVLTVKQLAYSVAMSKVQKLLFNFLLLQYMCLMPSSL